MIPRHIQPYIDNNQMSLRVKNVDGVDYGIVCYTKEQFFDHEWDEHTIRHRGVIYREDGLRVNRPFKKIFNIGENGITLESVQDRMKKEEFEILDKLNGHLVIVSCDAESHNLPVFVTTKGSMDSEMVDADREVCEKLGIVNAVKYYLYNCTLLFEALVKHDPHLWYEEQQKRYGVTEDTMILIGCIDNIDGHSYSHVVLRSMAAHYGWHVTERYTHLERGQISELYDHKGIEGYVIHFLKTGDRIKVKTTEYVSLHYLKGVTSQNFINDFYNSGYDNLLRTHDEELYPIVHAVKDDFYDFVKDALYTVPAYARAITDKKAIALDKTLTKFQKTWLFAGMPGPEYFLNSKQVRRDFKESMLFNKTDAAVKQLKEGLTEK